MKVGLIGSSGRLGLSIAKSRPSNASCLIQASSNPSTPHIYLDLSNGDIQTSLDKYFESCQVLIFASSVKHDKAHSLDKNSLTYIVNVNALRIVAEWSLRNSKHLIYVSGAIVYRDLGNKSIDEDALLGRNYFTSLYAESKLMAELMLHEIIKLGLKCTIIRPSSIFGGSYREPGWLDRLIKGSTVDSHIRIKRPIVQNIGFIHTDAVADCIMFLAERELSGTFNVSSYETLNVYEIARLISSLSGKPVCIEEGILSGHYGQDRYQLDLRKIYSVGWRPKQSLKDYIKHEYLSYLELDLINEVN